MTRGDDEVLGYDDAVRECTALFVAAKNLRKGDVRPLVEAIMRCERRQTHLAAWALYPYTQGGLEQDFSYLPSHSVNVASLCFQACRRGKAGVQARTVLTAALVHDVGMTSPDILPLVKEPPEVAGSRGKQPERERDVQRIVQKHPDYGMRRIRSWRGVTSTAARMALFHHRRKDGSGYPRGRIGLRQADGVYLLGLFDSLDAACHPRAHRELPQDLLKRLPWTVFDEEMEKQRGLYGEHVLDLARRCLYGIVCDRIAKDEVVPDLTSPFLEPYVRHLAEDHIRRRFASRLRILDLDDITQEAEIRLVSWVRGGRCKEPGALKRSARTCARRAALDWLEEWKKRKVTEGPDSLGNQPAKSPGGTEERLEDFFSRIGQRLCVEEVCVLVLRHVHEFSAEDTANVMNALFALDCPLRSEVLVNMCRSDHVRGLPAILHEKHLKWISTEPAPRVYNQNIVDQLMSRVYRKVQRRKVQRQKEHP